jgi:hypothetical protein
MWITAQCLTAQRDILLFKRRVRSRPDNYNLRHAPRALHLCGGRSLGILGASPPPRSHPAKARGDVAQVVEQAGKALAAVERAIERRHGAGNAGIFVIVNPGAQDRTEQQRKPCARTMPRGPEASIPAAVSIHCCERTASALSASASGGLRVAERMSERTAARCGASISSLRISTSNRRSRAGSSPARLDPRRARRGRCLDVRGQDSQRRGKFAAQLRERHAGLVRDLGKPDVFDSFLAEKVQERRYDFVAFGRRRGGFARGGSSGSCGRVCGP